CGTPVEGPEDVFCCAGCEMAAAIIKGAGLEAYYREREAFPPTPEGESGDWDALPVVAGDDGMAEIRLQVDGLRCASCVWVTENVLQRTTGVEEATLSYATGRARVKWDPTKVKLGEVAGRISALGYRPRILGEEGLPDTDLLVRLGVAAFAAMNIMMLSAALYTGWLGGMDPRYVALFQWISLALAAPVAIWCAEPFFVAAASGLRHGILHMDLPIALGVSVLFVHGAVVTIAGSGDTYLDSMGMLVTLLLLGRVLESRGRRRAAEAATAMAAAAPATARRRVGSAMEAVPAEDLDPGDLLDVASGEELAADGIVTGGRGSVRMALLTGEAEPVEVAAEDRVVAGSVVVDGYLMVRVTAVGRETVLQQMAEQLRLSADRGVKPAFTDRIAPWFTGATLLVAAATFLGWYAAAGIEKAILTFVAVLVVACPCALALSRPLAAAAGLGAAARRGLLFRSGDALLEMEAVDLVALDKTGTVTAGDLVVIDAPPEALRVASGLERFSGHPIARAIVRAAVKEGIPLPDAEEVMEEAGFGIRGRVDGRLWEVRSGGPGKVVVRDEEGEGWTLTLGDRVRDDSRWVVEEVLETGREVILVTGDVQEAAARMAGEAGIERFLASMTPAEKADWIRTHRDEGRTVLFAGDGLNDGPGLAQANVGVAMGTGAASSILVADGVISVPSLRPLLAGFRAAEAARRSIRKNQLRSIAYNIGAVTVAAGGWVNPLIAAILMPLSSGMVIWGASRVDRAVERGE
ncbi:MAG: heavy metal translocating P-type ATPase, partial [Longimicrobiales bacterium]